jgi:BirA family biotin operon repressor/biotin-[acetyl-CoA-carboxylase] ligase
LETEIKWPNDVLIEGKKVAGILVENHWQGCQLLDVILGIGINVGQDSIPADPPFIFPATSLETEVGKGLDRLEILVAVLESLLRWYRRLAEPSLIKAWNERLAYHGQIVSLTSSKGMLAKGKVLEVDPDGALSVETSSNNVKQFHSGEIQLRLVDRI